MRRNERRKSRRPALPKWVVALERARGTLFRRKHAYAMKYFRVFDLGKGKITSRLLRESARKKEWQEPAAQIENLGCQLLMAMV